MGARKKISAEENKEALKGLYFAKLNNVPPHIVTGKHTLE